MRTNPIARGRSMTSQDPLQAILDDINALCPLNSQEALQLRYRLVAERYPRLVLDYPVVALTMASGGYNSWAFKMCSRKIDEVTRGDTSDGVTRGDTSDEELANAHGSYVRFCYIKESPHYNPKRLADLQSFGAELYRSMKSPVINKTSDADQSRSKLLAMLDEQQLDV